MLKKLTLTNFRKHRELELHFEPGVVVVRGSNEAGKSTIFQAVAYALFGARALPESLEHVVTYGESPASLRVEIEAEFSGKRVEVARSSRGAELREGGFLVTGQTETAAYVSELVGAPAALATNLWFANQNNIRGALGAGSKATTSLIEQLADFEQIDRIIELIQNNLTTGPVKPFEERAEQAQTALAQLGDPQPPLDMSKQVEAASARVREAKGDMKLATSEYSDFVEAVLNPLIEMADNAGRAQLRAAEDEARLAKMQADLDSIVVPDYEEQAHRGAVALLADYDNQMKIVQAYKEAWDAFCALPIVKSVWEGDGPSFIAFCEKSETEREEVVERLGKLSADIAGQTQALLEGSCATCGLDYDNVPAVGERNRKTRALLDTMNKLKQVAERRKAELDTERAAIKIITQQWQLYRDFVAKHASYVSVDTNFVPPKLEWTASEPATPTYQQVKDDIAKYERDAKARAAALARVERLTEDIKDLSDAIDIREINIELESEKFMELPLMRAHADDLEARMRLAAKVYDEALKHHDALKAEHDTAVAVYEERKKTFGLLKQALDDAIKQIDDLNFNNTLLKKVRSARPAIIDRLWSVLLAAVSHYFSQMRGTQSAVSREGGAFLVDGKPIEGLSGSTLDILGLAIRVALLKTFLPACSFLVLDEPAAACDEDREAALLGTIAAAQFEQVLLITHSDIADPFANQLITLK